MYGLPLLRSCRHIRTDRTHEQLIAIHWNIVVKQNKSLISVATVQPYSRHYTDDQLIIQNKYQRYLADFVPLMIHTFIFKITGNLTYKFNRKSMRQLEKFHFVSRCVEQVKSDAMKKSQIKN